MEPNQSSIIRQAADIIKAAKIEVTALLDKLPHSNLSLATEPALQGIINRLYFLSGTTQDPETTSKVEFPPVTNFMGEEITYPKPIKVEDLTPKEADRAVFIDKVTRLYAELPSISADGILNAFTLPEDVLVLRGVAKKAGVHGYDSKPINKEFIEEIVKAIELKQGEINQQAAIDAAVREEEEKRKLEEQKLIESTSNDEDEDEALIDHILTEEDFKNNPELTAQGLKVGDVISIPMEDNLESESTQAESTPANSAPTESPVNSAPATDQQNVKQTDPAKEPATEGKKKSGPKK